MKKSNIEILALIIGLLVLTASAFLMFSGALSGGDSIFYTNISIAVGFLVYIVYNWLATNSLNKEIRNLQQHVKSLKDEIKRKEAALEEKAQQNKVLENEKAGLNQQLIEAQEKISGLEQALEKAREENNPPSQEEA